MLVGPKKPFSFSTMVLPLFRNILFLLTTTCSNSGQPRLKRRPTTGNEIVQFTDHAEVIPFFLYTVLYNTLTKNGFVIVIV